MYKRLIFITIVITFYLIICKFIYYKSINYKVISTNQKLLISNIIHKNKEIPIGKLIIKKINIDNNLYKTTSKLNNVDKNITILNNSIEPNNKNSIMFIAAHSGNSDISYFKDLDKLNINDEIILFYKNKYYHYIINKIWEENKNGYIHVTKEDNKQLVLTTCSPKHENKQLIINSTLKRVY